MVTLLIYIVLLNEYGVNKICMYNNKHILNTYNYNYNYINFNKISISFEIVLNNENL